MPQKCINSFSYKKSCCIFTTSLSFGLFTPVSLVITEMCYNRLGQWDAKDPSEYSISIINLLDKVPAPWRISEYIISSLISHHHAKILPGRKQKQMGEKWGGSNILDTKWSRKDGYEEQESRIILCITLFRHSFNKPSTNFQFVCAITDGERLESLGCLMVLPRFLASWMYFCIGGENGQTHKAPSETAWPREKGKLIFITHTSGVRRKGQKTPFYIHHYLVLRHLSVLFHQRSNPHLYHLHTIRTYVAELQKHNKNCQGYSDA